MQIGIVGLGRMGANISRRLMKAGHKAVVYDINAAPRDALGKEGAPDQLALHTLLFLLLQSG